MSATPLPPGCSDPDGAAEIETGLEQPVNTISTGQSQELLRLRRQRHVEQVNCLRTSRVWFEFVDELVRYHPEIAEDIDRRLEQYAGLDPDVLHVLGADRFPPVPLRVVGGAP
jgi:hypothetical protein